jgi:hypothetical protein
VSSQQKRTGEGLRSAAHDEQDGRPVSDNVHRPCVALRLDVWVSFGLGVVVGGCRGRASRGRAAKARKNPCKALPCKGFCGGQGQGRTADLWFFRPALYQLSYLTGQTPAPGPRPGRVRLAGATGFEPAISGLTGRRELQTSPRPRSCPQGNSNPRCRLERAES